jgi:hypothetical protein
VENRNDPEDVALASHERLSLLRIEAALRQDRRLARRMRHPGSRPCLPLSVPTCASLLLLVTGILATNLVAPWCFAALWPVTLLLALRLLRHPSRAEDRSRSRP